MDDNLANYILVYVYQNIYKISRPNGAPPVTNFGEISAMLSELATLQVTNDRVSISMNFQRVITFKFKKLY
jgi:hypothetical protein